MKTTALLALFALSGLAHAQRIPLSTVPPPIVGTSPGRTPLPLCEGVTAKTSNTTVSIRSSCRLQSRSELDRVSFAIEGSDIHFDCAYSTLRGLPPGEQIRPIGSRYPDGHAPVSSAFIIKSSANRPRKNITISNCTVANFVVGADVRTMVADSDTAALRAAGHDRSLSRGERALVDAIEDRLRAQAPGNIRFSEVDFINSHKNGIYAKWYVTGLTFTHGTIRGSGNSGIYLDAGSRGNTISDSVFRDNGFYNYGTNPDEDDYQTITGRGSSPAREAIAVDSSAENVFLRNTFEHNGGGGVFLYKNCWEHHTDAEQRPRWQHSRDNRFEGNTFIKEKVGIWIASRQSRGYTMSMGCGDRGLFNDGLPFFPEYVYRDYAEDSVVVGNYFEDNQYGLKVEDDGALVRDNTFSGSTEAGLYLGSRGKLKGGNGPVRGTTIEGNTFLAGDKVAHVYGTRDATFRDNQTATGAYRSPCTAPFYVAAEDEPASSCRMETTGSIAPSAAAQFAPGSSFFFQDTTRAGYSEGVWGKGTFTCGDGNWVRVNGQCCAGTSCN
jgi:hypothetical protein